MKMQKRTPKQDPKETTAFEELFAREYLKDFNATQALTRCGKPYKTYAVLRQAAMILIAKHSVQQVIEREANKAAAKVEVDVESILRELQIMAHFDPNDLYDENQCLRRIQDMPVSVRKNIASIECDEIWEYEQEGKKRIKTQVGVTKKIRLWPKDRGVEMLGKYLAMFVDRQRHEDPSGNALPAVQVHVHRSNAAPVTEAAKRPEVQAAAQ